MERRDTMRDSWAGDDDCKGEEEAEMGGNVIRRSFWRR
jgi:hypothetical protein